MALTLRVGRHAGFCAGVQNAVAIALEAARQCESSGDGCASLGPLIHNSQVLDLLESKGIHAATCLEDINSGGVVIRSHGVSREALSACYAKGLTVYDATCPHVTRMHRMVHDAPSGLPVIIIGQADHPEVIGTAGWARGQVIILESIQEVCAMPRLQEAMVVAQTTIPRDFYDMMVQELSGRVDHLNVINTVCPATAKRQEEARELARWADVMIVVGSRLSSNTRKLAATCGLYCPGTILVETCHDIPGDLIPIGRDHGIKVGITAGASTPDWLFKEVVNRMNDMENVAQAAIDQQATVTVEAPKDAAMSADAEANANFMADVEATLVKIRPGQTVTGTVVQVTEDEVCVNIGFKSDGLVKRSDLVSKDVKLGDEIDVEVIKVNDGEGNVLLSQRNVVSRKSWDALMAKYDANEFVDGVGREAVKGGLIANVLGVRAFIPASQLSQRYVEKIDDFVGKPMRLKIIEVDRAKKRIVCSRKAVIAEEAVSKKKEAWDRLNEGDVITGIVRRLTDFGAFVDIGGVDGLVHVTDLSWGRVRHPSEVVQPGQEIKVKILSLEVERERIQLGYKQTQPRPWDIAEEKYPAGLVTEGKVVRITTFGAFVELEPGLDGLVHISQCALVRIGKVEDAVQVGQSVRVKVLGVDPVAKRISLSIRAVLEDEAFVYSDEIPGEGLEGEYTGEPSFATEA